MGEWIHGPDGFVMTSNGAFAAVLEVWAQIGRGLGDRSAHELAAWFQDTAANGGLGCRAFSLTPLDDRLASPEQIVALDAIVRELARLLTFDNPPADVVDGFMWAARVEWLAWMLELLRLIALVAPVALPPPPEPPARDVEELAFEQLRHSIFVAKAGTEYRDPGRWVELLYEAIEMAAKIGWHSSQRLRYELFDALKAAGRDAELPAAYRDAAAHETDLEMKAVLDELAAFPAGAE